MNAKRVEKTTCENHYKFAVRSYSSSVAALKGEYCKWMAIVGNGIALENADVWPECPPVHLVFRFAFSGSYNSDIFEFAFFSSTLDQETKNGLEISSALNIPRMYKKIINFCSIRVRFSAKAFLCHSVYWLWSTVTSTSVFNQFLLNCNAKNERRGFSTRRLFHFIHKLFTVHFSTLHKIAASSSLSISAAQPSLCKAEAQKIRCTKRNTFGIQY